MVEYLTGNKIESDDYKLYIFRIHMAYKAKHDSAMLNSILYLSCVLMFVLLPIAGVILEIARKGGRINTAFFILYFISILGFVTMKYGNKKMVERLYKKYSQHKFNRIIPTYCFFLILPICIILGMSIYIIILKYFVDIDKIRDIIYNILTSSY